MAWGKQFLAALLITVAAAPAQAPPTAAPSSKTSVIGAITAVRADGLTLKTDLGQVVEVQFAPGAKILEAAPGEKSLAAAQSISSQSLASGDRVLARGTMASGGLLASTVVSMKQSEIARKQEEERQAWAQRGVSGTVKSVDLNSGTILLDPHGANANQSLNIVATKDTVLRRYAHDSAKFSDTHPGTLNEIQPGDQLRALESRSANGGELIAEQIVSGKFRNIAATVIAADAAAGTLTVVDLASRKPVSLKVSVDSGLHALPPFMAQRLAMRWRNSASRGSSPSVPRLAAANPDSGLSQPPRRTMDLQQMLERLPVLSLADLHKGDALMIVATEGGANAPSSAVTVLSGVEPILSAAPSANEAAVLLSPWNLGGGAPADAASGP